MCVFSFGKDNVFCFVLLFLVACGLILFSWLWRFCFFIVLEKERKVVQREGEDLEEFGEGKKILKCFK